MPVALISTRTSPAFGPSRSSSMISSGFFASNATAARVFILNSTFASQRNVKTYCHLHAADHRRRIPNSSLAHAGILGLLRGGRLVFLLSRPHAPYRVAGAGPQIDVEVVHVAGNVRVVTEGRHDVLLRTADVLAAAGEHAEGVQIGRA